MGIKTGCGSWADDEYEGVLYPPESSAKDRLKNYSSHFDHVEVNSSFYATPRANVVAGWLKQTPKTFTFDIKLHRAFAQNPHRAATEGRLIKALLSGVESLIAAKRLGAFLLVLPPTFSPARHELSELDALVEKLQPHRLAVELRHNAWVKGKARSTTLDYFRERGAVWVAVDMPRISQSDIMPAVDEVTNPKLAYLRLHGRNPRWLEAESAEERHAHDYSRKELREIVARVQRLADQAKEVHVIANNHAKDFAPKAALRLKQLLSEQK